MPNTSIKTPAPGQQGFTLIEIIAVLVILGILSAVAVPKFIDLQNEAREKGLESVVSAAQSNLHMEYGRNLLEHEGSQTDAFNSISLTVCEKVSADGWLADATVSCERSENEHITITANYEEDSADGTFTNPGNADDLVD